MISRRKIISRSLDNLDAIGPNAEEEEDVWYDKEKLFRVSFTQHKQFNQFFKSNFIRRITSTKSWQNGNKLMMKFGQK